MYAKLFASLYQGTLRGCPDELLVFTNLLATADAHGHVDKHWKAIAEEVGISRERVEQAIKNLEAPDPDSRSPELEGRRLLPLDEHRAWGWQIVNYGKYREIRNEDDRREQNRLAQQRYRERQAERKQNADNKHDSYNKQNKPKQKQKHKAEEEEEKELRVVSPEAGSTSTNGSGSGSTDKQLGAVERVFNEWKTVLNHPLSKLDAKRREIIRARLRDFSVEELCRVPHGVKNTPHNMGENEHRKVYDSIKVVFRDADQVERFLAADPGDTTAQSHPIEECDRCNEDGFIQTDTGVMLRCSHKKE